MSTERDLTRRLEVLAEFGQLTGRERLDSRLERWVAWNRAQKVASVRAAEVERDAHIRIMRLSRPKVFIPPFWRRELIREREQMRRWNCYSKRTVPASL